MAAERPEQSSRWLIGGAPDVVAGEADQSRDRQERNLRSIVRHSGFEITGVYKEKASGAKTDRFVAMSLFVPLCKSTHNADRRLRLAGCHDRPGGPAAAWGHSIAGDRPGGLAYIK